MRRLAYVNADCYVDVDLTVLKHLARHYQIDWYPVYYTDRPIYYNPDQMAAYAAEYGIEYHPCPRLYRQRDVRNLRFYSEIVKDINSRGADLVYSCITEELYWALASRKLKSERVLGLHDVVMHSFSNPVKRFIQTAIREYTIRGSANVCVFSENQKKLFTVRYGRKAWLLGLCSRTFGPSQAVLPDISKGVHLLFFGNIVHYKGLDLLISTIESLRREGMGNLYLTVAGKGDYWPECESCIKTPEAFDLKVRFIDNEEIPDLIATHHFMALPYRNATQSGPLMIAVGGGMPVLAPSYGCFQEQYNDRSAVLYSDLSDALRRISHMTQDEYSAMHSSAEQLKENSTEEVVTSKYIRCFDSICHDISAD